MAGEGCSAPPRAGGPLGAGTSSPKTRRAKPAPTPSHSHRLRESPALPQPHFCWCFTLNFAGLSGVNQHLTAVSICIFLITNEVEHPLYVLWSFGLFWDVSVYVFCPFFF